MVAFEKYWSQTGWVCYRHKMFTGCYFRCSRLEWLYQDRFRPRGSRAGPHCFYGRLGVGDATVSRCSFGQAVQNA